jgi:hypothetical protein
MPLGPIHLVGHPGDYETEAVMYCGATDVVAAIHPDRVPEYAWELMCPTCLAILRGDKANKNGATG